MVSYLALACVGLAVAYLVNTYRCFTINLAAAKKSGLPYICMPVYTFNRFWLTTHVLWLPIIKKTFPASWATWTEYVSSLTRIANKHVLYFDASLTVTPQIRCPRLGMDPQT
jgi:hypothetical protein